MSQALKRILADISRVEGVKGVIVVSKDGLVLDAVVPSKDVSTEEISAAVSQIVSVAGKLGKDFGIGNTDIITLEYDNGRIMVGDIGDNFILVVADKSALVGMIRNEIKRQRDKIKAIVG